MEISQWGLARLYGYALILGCVLGAAYDILRITRIFFGIHYSQRAIKRKLCVRLPLLKSCTERKKHRALGVVIFLEDFVFCVFSAVALILLFYVANNGKIRYLAFLVTGAGFLFYRITLGKFVMLCSEIIAFFVEISVRYFFFFLFFPGRFACKQLWRITCSICLYAKKKQAQRCRVRFTAKELQRNDQNACGLIPENLPREQMQKR